MILRCEGLVVIAVLVESRYVLNRHRGYIAIFRSFPCIRWTDV